MAGEDPRAVAFGALVERVQACRRCPSMEGRRRVLGAANGSPRAGIMLVGEAPGRLGAERTGVPFSGDASGKRLDALLVSAGWSRGEVFITNAVLCNPRDARGRNRPPSVPERVNCLGHLAQTIQIIQPRVLIALGRQAAAALNQAAPSAAWERTAAPGELYGLGTAQWGAWMLHPSPLTNATRRWPDQLADWQALGARVAANRHRYACAVHEAESGAELLG